MFAYRPRTATAAADRKMYAPHRDLAHAGVGLLRPVVISLEPRFREEWFTRYLVRNHVTDDELNDGVCKLMQGVTTLVKTKDPPAGMAESGFDQLYPELQAAIYARVGQVFLAALWEGVKDVSRPDSDPPPEMHDVYQAVEDLVLFTHQRRTLWGRITFAISTIFGRYPTATSPSTSKPQACRPPKTSCVPLDGP